MPLEPAQIQQLCAAILRSHHRFLAIRPVNYVPREGPCVRLAERSIASFAVALRAAYAHWPDVRNWELIGADAELEPTAETHPVQFDRSPQHLMARQGRFLENPQHLAMFDTAEPGDQEAA